jgi:formate-dependent nitrite reductase membrane component NrfD
MAACPYDAIFINPEDHSAEKCNLCAHRLDLGLEPACVTVCPVEAILVGDLNDPDSKASQVISTEPVQVRRPEKETHPGVFYKGAQQATLDPLAAVRPEGGLYAWATQGPGPQPVSPGGSQAAALISYDVPHRAPWGWRVSLYTWTKSIAAGGFGVPVGLAAAGYLSWTSAAVRWEAPVVGLVFLAITGGLLITDLKHPMRFYLIFTRPHWRSWLVRGAFIVSGYGAVLTAYLLAALVGVGGSGAAAGGAAGITALEVLGWTGMVAAVGTAVYTAFLFAQAKGRDLWQSPVLGPHLAVQAVLAGAAVVLLGGRAVRADEVLVAVAAGVHLVLVGAELGLHRSGRNGTGHARLASDQLTVGRYRRSFWISVVLVLVGVGAPWLGMGAGPVVGPVVLAGLLAYEHAYVRAGQCVPLA